MLALLLLLAGAPDPLEASRALDALMEAYAVDQRPEILIEMGEVLAELGRYEEAEEALRRASETPKLAAAAKRRAESRRAAIAPRRAKAPVMTGVSSAELLFTVDGAPALERTELLLEPGPRCVVVRWPGASQALLRRVAFKAGTRTILDARLADPRPSDAILAVGGLERLALGGCAVDLRGLTRLRVDPGPYAVALVPEGQSAEVRGTVELAPGARAALEALVAPPAPPPPVVAEAPPPARRWLLPAIVAGAGVAASGVGGFLVADAERARAQVLDAPRDARGAITGVTLAEAVDIRDSAASETTAGRVVLGAGLAAAAAGLTWLVVSLASD